MNRVRALFVALATVAALYTVGAVPASAAPASPSVHTARPCPLGYHCYDPSRSFPGCPIGYVCIYPGASFSGTPQRYYYYGTYNLQNEFGYHMVVNNQYVDQPGDLPQLWLYRGYNATGYLWDWLPMGNYGAINLTPINSINLSPV
jgi:hypothetical protein